MILIALYFEVDLSYYEPGDLGCKLGRIEQFYEQAIN